MATLLSGGEEIKCWRVIDYSNGSNALNYVAEFVPGASREETDKRIRNLFHGGKIPDGFDPFHDKVFLKQFVDPCFHDEILVPFEQYQKKIHRKINSCGDNCFCREWDSFILKDRPGRRGYYQVLEYFPDAKSLKDSLEKNSLSWKERVHHAKALAYGLQLLHEAGIVHADLKPDNLLIVGNRRPDGKMYGIPTALKIIDFDSSLLVKELSPRHKLAKEPDKYRYRGTAGYLSPEHFGGKIPVPASDVFTAAIIICEMLSPDGYPFPGSREEYRDAVRNKRYNLKRLRCNGCQSTVDMLKACFSMNPDDRPAAARLLRELQNLPEKL